MGGQAMETVTNGASELERLRAVVGEITRILTSGPDPRRSADLIGQVLFDHKNDIVPAPKMVHMTIADFLAGKDPVPHNVIPITNAAKPVIKTAPVVVRTKKGA